MRIEDDDVVTAIGVEWISRAPRELDEVEGAIKAQARGPGAAALAGPGARAEEQLVDRTSKAPLGGDQAGDLPGQAKRHEKRREAPQLAG